MKKFKSIFLVLVIMLLSLGFTSTTYARERNGSSGRDRDRDYGSRGYRNGRDNNGGSRGPKLNYDGKTSKLRRKCRRHCSPWAAADCGRWAQARSFRSA